jgi:hypothetical protein
MGLCGAYPIKPLVRPPRVAWTRVTEAYPVGDRVMNPAGEIRPEWEDARSLGGEVKTAEYRHAMARDLS